MIAVRYPKVEVVWFDANSGLGQWNVSELKSKDFNPYLTTTCGYLIHKDEEKLVIGFTIFGNDNLDDIKHFQMIPKGMVKNILYLKESGKRK